MDGIDNRNVPSMRSHAQKYFINLWKNGIELPDKVKETGSGYTLSGKPLDPMSGAARMYAKQHYGGGIIPKGTYTNPKGKRFNTIPYKIKAGGGVGPKVGDRRKKRSGAPAARSTIKGMLLVSFVPPITARSVFNVFLVFLSSDI